MKISLDRGSWCQPIVFALIRNGDVPTIQVRGMENVAQFDIYETRQLVAVLSALVEQMEKMV